MKLLMLSYSPTSDRRLTVLPGNYWRQKNLATPTELNKKQNDTAVYLSIIFSIILANA